MGEYKFNKTNYFFYSKLLESSTSDATKLLHIIFKLLCTKKKLREHRRVPKKVKNQKNHTCSLANQIERLHILTECHNNTNNMCNKYKKYMPLDLNLQEPIDMTIEECKKSNLYSCAINSKANLMPLLYENVDIYTKISYKIVIELEVHQMECVKSFDIMANIIKVLDYEPYIKQVLINAYEHNYKPKCFKNKTSIINKLNILPEKMVVIERIAQSIIECKNLLDTPALDDSVRRMVIHTTSNVPLIKQILVLTSNCQKNSKGLYENKFIQAEFNLTNAKFDEIINLLKKKGITVENLRSDTINIIWNTLINQFYNYKKQILVNYDRDNVPEIHFKESFQGTNFTF